MKLEYAKPKPFSGRATVKDPKAIGSIIRELRKESHMTQAKAAAMCNVGARFLSDLENGKATIQLGKALKVLQAFGLRIILKKRTLTNE
jgi:HTH-type transcriptional regulator/antitoxin HipB